MDMLLSHPPRPPQLGAPRSVIVALVVDLLLALVATLALSVLVVSAVIALHALQTGLDLNQLGQLSADEALRLVGGGGMLMLLLLQNAIFVGIPFVRVRWLRREPLDVLGFTASRPLRLLLFGVALSCVTLLLNGVAGAIFISFGIRQNQAALYPLYAGDYLGQLFFWIGAGIAAPIGEEVLFRGYLFGSLRRLAADSRARLAAAYMVSALVFALFHVMAASEGVIALLVPSFIIGLTLAWGYDRSGSLVPGIVAHAFNNSIAVAALLVCVNNSGLCPQ